MELEEMLEQTNETENVETQTTEEISGGIDLTDTSDDAENNADTETKEVKTLRDLLRENPEYQKEFNGMIQNRLDKKDREYQRKMTKYLDTENVLRTTLGVKEGEDVNTKLREAYKADGIELPEAYKPRLSSRDTERLGLGDAEDIIADGYDVMMEEAERLAKIGYQNLTEREKVTFTRLAEKLTEEKEKTALLKLGAKEELLKDDDFIKFKKQFKSDTPIEAIYSLYKNNQSKPQIDNPGSMRNDKRQEPKTRFTSEEIAKMTDEELEENWEAIRKFQTSGNH